MERSKLLNDLADCYYEMAGLQLTMNLFSFYEGYNAEQEDDNERMRTPLAKIAGTGTVFCGLKSILDKLYSEDTFDSDVLIRQAEELREGVKLRTLTLATYSDRFKLYEYILNRVKPVPLRTLSDINNDAAARDILSAIFSKNDNALINENIKFVLSQLPIRMTKARFYDILDLTCKKYTDGSLSALKRACYMISSAAGVSDEPESDDEPDNFSLHGALTRISELACEELDEKEYDEAEQILRMAVDYLVDATDVFRSLAEIINMAIVMLRSRDKASASVIALPASFSDVVGTVTSELVNGTYADVSDRAIELFKKTEGRLEYGFEKLLSLETKAENAHCSDDKDITGYISTCRKLMSESVFADLNEEEDDAIVDKAAAEREAKELMQRFDNAFAADDRVMKRARMAAALGEVPVFFDSRTEVMNYVRDSIDGCRNQYEKLVSVKLVTDFLKA